MKKSIKKLYAILIIVMMLWTYIPALISGVEATSSEYIKGEITLESNASKYNVGDTIVVNLVAKNLGEYQSITDAVIRLKYDRTALKYTKCEINDPENYGLRVTDREEYINFQMDNKNSLEYGTIREGDVIITFYFEALQDSTHETQVECISDSTGGFEFTTENNGDGLYNYGDPDDNVELPSITLPVPPNTNMKTHNITVKLTNGEDEVLEGGIFKIVLPDGSSTFAETASDGTFTLPNLQMPEGTSPVVYTILQKVAPEGYIVNENPSTISIIFDEEGNVQTVVATNGVATNTENDITLTIINEKEEPEIIIEQETFYMELTKVDEESNIITSDEATFKISSPVAEDKTESTTNGKTIKIEFKAPTQAGTYPYVIEEIKAPNGYTKSLENVILDLKFENIENTIKLTSANIVSYGKPAIINEATGNKVIEFDIVNKKEKIVTPHNYEINITNVKDDTFNTAITEPNIGFAVTFEGKSQYIKTNTLGRATYNFSLNSDEIDTSKLYTFTIEQVQAPNGYILDGEAKTVNLKFNEDGTIKEMTVQGQNIIKENNTETASNVKIVNIKKQEPVVLTPETFNLIINKQDEQGNLITSSTAKFNLILPDGTKTSYETQNGVTTNISLTAPNAPGKQVYFIQETKAPTGYEKLKESLVVEMNFVEENGKIVISNAVLKEETDKQVVPTQVEGVNTITINIKNSKIEKYYIDIVNVDKDTDVELTGGIFKLTNSATSEYKYIDNNKIEIDMPTVAGTVVYTIDQISVANGYIINKEQGTLSIEFRANSNGSIYLHDYTVTGTNNEKMTTSELNTALLKIKNEKEAPIIETTKDNYAIEITKVDSQTGETITSPATFEVIPTQQKTYTTSNGIIRIENLVAGEEELFVIQEKQAPEGYELLQESIAIKLISEENNNKISVVDAQIQIGSDIAEVVIENGIIKVKVKNTKKEEDHLYVKSRKDSTGTDIYDLMNSYTGDHYTIENPFIDTRIAKSGNNMTVQEFINNLESNGILTVWDETGNQISASSRVKTKMILKANKGNEELTFVIIVKGDGDGDGRVRSKDLDILTKHLSEEKKVTDPYFLRALDLAKDGGDGRVRSNDLDELVRVLSI